VSISTDWLIAQEADAEAVASILTTEERSFDDWPSLCLQGVGQLELQHLAASLRGDGQSTRSVLGSLLHQASEQGPFVAAVDSGFIEALATLEESSLGAVSEAWQQSEHLRDWPLAEVGDTLSQMVAFARRARESGTPVLELVTF
jgi:hypothetical protein